MRPNDNALSPDRREFARMALGGAALLASAGRGSAKLPNLPPGIKIGTGGGSRRRRTCST